MLRQPSSPASGIRIKGSFRPSCNLSCDDLGLIEHPAPNVEPGDVVVLADGREALVTARVDAPIDGVIALCMALDRCEHKPERVRLLGWV